VPRRILKKAGLAWGLFGHHGEIIPTSRAISRPVLLKMPIIGALVRWHRRCLSAWCASDLKQEGFGDQTGHPAVPRTVRAVMTVGF